MKNIQEILQESVLDDQNEIIAQASKKAEFQALLAKFQEYAENPNKTDVLGNPLAPGDLVLYIPTKGGFKGRQTLQLGLVLRLSAKGVTLKTAPHKSHFWYSDTEDNLMDTLNVPFGACYKIENI